LIFKTIKNESSFYIFLLFIQIDIFDSYYETRISWRKKKQKKNVILVCVFVESSLNIEKENLTQNEEKKIYRNRIKKQLKVIIFYSVGNLNRMDIRIEKKYQ
jgi:hypothetical protein